MKIIRFNEAQKQERPDGRTVTKLAQQEFKIDVSNMQMLYVIHPPNLKEDLHAHNKSYEILIFQDNAKYKINGKDYNLNKNDVVIFEPGDVHGAIPIENEVGLWVFQNPAILEDKVIIK